MVDLVSFHDVRLPDDVERGARGGPAFNTTVLLLGSGYERRNVNWERTRGHWDLAYGLRTKADAESTLAFFYARLGRACGFRFKDWTDYSIGSTGSPQVIATGGGGATKFQIVRRYTSGGYTYSRYITRPVAGSIKVYLDGVEQVSGFTVNAATGVITFTGGAPSGVIGVTGEFDVPVRFDTDDLELQAYVYGNYAMPSVPIVEIREELASLT